MVSQAALQAGFTRRGQRRRGWLGVAADTVSPCPQPWLLAGQLDFFFMPSARRSGQVSGPKDDGFVLRAQGDLVDGAAIVEEGALRAAATAFSAWMRAVSDSVIPPL